MGVSNTLKPLLVLSLFLSSTVSAISIIVHGTFAAQDTWYKPGSSFFAAFSEAQEKKEMIIPFTWSGDLTHVARVSGAQDLAELILQYPKESVNLVGHSHGANVINLASNLLALARHTIEHQQDEIYLQHIEAMVHLFVSAPVMYEHSATCMSYTRAVTHVNAEIKQVSADSVDDLRVLLAAAVDVLRKKMQQTSEATRAMGKKYLINRVQLLAVPILTDNYAPNMEIIKRAENYYSQEDWIQAFAGNQGHIYPPNPRMIQVRVCFCDTPSSRAYFDPDHSGMHDVLVAKWLPKAPKLLGDNLLGKHVVMVIYRNEASPFVQEIKVRMLEEIVENRLLIGSNDQTVA
jgi:hypothetical protein